MDGRKGRRNGWSKNVKKVNKPRKKKKKNNHQARKSIYFYRWKQFTENKKGKETHKKLSTTTFNMFIWLFQSSVDTHTHKKKIHKNIYVKTFSIGEK